MMLLSVGISAALAVAFAIARSRGLLSVPTLGWVGPLFPLAYLALAGMGLYISRRGQVRRAVHLYILLDFVVLLLAGILGGTASPAWLLFFWPVTLAGMFLRPIAAVWGSGGVVLGYVAVVLAERADLYTPVLSFSVENFHFFAMFFFLTMLFVVAGVVNYLNTGSLRRSLSQVREVTQALERSRSSLETRVAERTAELSKRAEQFQAIAELSRAVASLTEFQHLLDASVQLIAQRLGFYHVGLFFVEPGGEWAVLRAASSEGGRRMLERGHRLRLGEQGIVGHVAASGTARFAYNVGEDAVWFNNPDLPETQSEIALPLIGRGQSIIGVLDIQTQEPAAFDEEDVEVLRTLAGGIAVAIENVRALEESQVMLQRLRRFQEEGALQAWRQALARRNLTVGYMYGGDDVIPVSEDEVQTMGQDQPELLGVTTRVADDGSHVLLAPVRVQEQNLGVLSFEKPEPWTDDEVQLAQFVVQQLDLALDNARLLEQTRRQASQERARSEIVSRVRALTSTDAILRNAARELGRALQVERSRIQLLPFAEREQQVRGE
jgi:GAF domain-containing protein